MQPILGIDFGTHSAKLAYLKEGTPVLLTNAQGKLDIPFILGVGKNNEFLIGENARTRYLIQPESFIHSFFPLIGRKYNDPFVEEFSKWCSEPVLGKNPDQDVSMLLCGREYTVLELCAIFMDHLKKEAEARSGIPFSRAVLSIPAHFGERQVVSLKESAERGGFDVLQVIHQPSASALNFRFELEMEQDNQHILVISFGKVIDISVILLKKGAFTVLSSEGNSLIGGDLLNQHLVDLLLRNIRQNYKMDLRSTVPIIRRMIPFVESPKTQLSTQESCEIRLRVAKDQMLTVDISREEFTAEINPELEKIIELTRSVLQQARLSPDIIDHVVLFGGSSLVPAVNEKLGTLFNPQKIRKSLNPFKATALGLAIQTSLISTYQCKKCESNNPIRADQCQQCSNPFELEQKITCPICYIPNTSDAVRCWKCSHVFSQESSKPDDIVNIAEKVTKDVDQQVPTLDIDKDGRLKIQLPINLDRSQTVGFIIAFAPDGEIEIPVNQKENLVIPVEASKNHEGPFRVVISVKKKNSTQKNFLGTVVYPIGKHTLKSPINIIIEPEQGFGLYVKLQQQNGLAIPAGQWYQGRRGRFEAKLILKEQKTKISGNEKFPVTQQYPCKHPGCSQYTDLWCGLCGNTTCKSHLYPGMEGTFVCEKCLFLLITREVQLANQSGDLESILEFLEVIRPIRPNLVNYFLGLIYAEQGKFDQACSLLNPSLGQNINGMNTPVEYAWAVIGKAESDFKKTDFLSTARGISHSLNYDPILKTFIEKVHLTDWEALGCVENGDLNRAVQIWQNELLNQPFDISIMHHLAVLYYQLAGEMEEKIITEIKTSGNNPKGLDIKKLDQYWKNCIIYWSSVLYSSMFWDQWLIDRKNETGFDYKGDNFKEQVREATVERLVQDFREYASQYLDLKKVEHESRMVNLEIIWGLERATAEKLGVVAIEFRIPNWPQGFSCGPLLLDDLRRNPISEKIVQSYSRALVSLNDTMSQTVKKYLSPSGRHYYMVEHNMIDQAIRELEPLEAWPQSREILAMAYMRKGSDLLASQDVENGLSAFEQAKSKGADITPHAEEIAEASVLRAKDIIQSSSNPQDKVIWLLERARALAGNHPDICSNLGATLTQKAIMLNNSKNYPEAERLIRRAVQLTPSDNHTRKTASIILSNQALEFAKLNQKDKAINLMTESVNLDPDYTGGNPAHEARRIIMSTLVISGSDEITNKNFDKGIRIMKDALNYLNDPDARKIISVALHNKGVELVNNERYDQGISMLLEALSYNDNTDTRKVLAQAYILRAVKKYQNGDRYGGIRDADEALRYDPYNRDIRDIRNKMSYY